MNEQPKASAGCFGIGSFQSMFSSKSAKKNREGIPKSFPLSSLEPYLLKSTDITVSDRQQYPHVALRCSEIQWPGGLGNIILENGSCLIWKQQESRDTSHSHLQDITNNANHHQIAKELAIRIPFDQIRLVKPIQYRNQLPGIELELSSKTTVMLVFMPGPYSNAQNCQNLLNAIQFDLLRLKKKEEEVSIPEESKEQPEMVDYHVANNLVLQYVCAAEGSEERQMAVNEIASSFAYPLDFRANGTRVRESITQQIIHRCMTDMKRFKELDIKTRQMKTNSRSEQTMDGNFEYYDLDSNEKILPKEYERRYFEFIVGPSQPKPRHSPQLASSSDPISSPSNPVLTTEIQNEETVSDEKNESSDHKVVQALSSSASSNDVPLSNAVADFRERKNADDVHSSSCRDSIMSGPTNEDASLQLLKSAENYTEASMTIPEHWIGTPQEAQVASITHACNQEIKELEKELWNQWDETLRQFYLRVQQSKATWRTSVENVTQQMSQTTLEHSSSGQCSEKKHDVVKADSDDPKSSSSSADARQRKARRRSLVEPDPHEISSFVNINNKSSSSILQDHTTNESSTEAAAANSRKRSARRRSILMPDDLNVFKADITSAATMPFSVSSTSASSHVQSKHKSLFDINSSHDVNPNATSLSSSTLSPSISPRTCQLCWDHHATLFMEPCQHQICPSCYDKLGPSEQEDALCPWDRLKIKNVVVQTHP